MTRTATANPMSAARTLRVAGGETPSRVPGSRNGIARDPGAPAPRDDCQNDEELKEDTGSRGLADETPRERPGGEHLQRGKRRDQPEDRRARERDPGDPESRVDPGRDGRADRGRVGEA